MCFLAPVISVLILTVHQYELTPYEFGTWMSPVASFADIEFLGTTIMDGKPVNTSACVKGFDRVE